MPVEPAPTGDTAKPPEKGAALDKLAPEDRALALAQATCPVSDGKLGSMGTPIKEVVDGKTVFLCCESCEDDLKAEPAKYLAKLKK